MAEGATARALSRHPDMQPEPLLHPHILDAAPLGPLVEPWPDGASWVCVYLSDGVRLLVGPHARWSLVREGVGRVAVGWVEEV